MNTTRFSKRACLAIFVLFLAGGCRGEMEKSLPSPLSPLTSPTPSVTARPSSTHTPLSPTVTPTLAATVTPTPSPVPLALSAPITALPTLPSDFPYPPLGYRYVAQNDQKVFLLAEHLITFDGVRVRVFSAEDEEQPLWEYAPSEWRVEDYVVRDDVVLVSLRKWSGSTSERRVGIAALRLEDGHTLWQQWFPPVETNLVGGYWMAAGASTVYGIDTFTNTLTALDLRSGEQLWHHERACRSPAVLSDEGIWVQCAGGTTHLEARTGVTLSVVAGISADLFAEHHGYLFTTREVYSEQLPYIHQVPTTTLSVWATPYEHPLWDVTSRGYLSGFWTDDDSVMYRIGPDVRRVSLPDGRVLWETTLPDEIGTNLYVADGVVLAGSGSGYLHALDLESGFVLWTQDLWTTLTPNVLSASLIGMREDNIYIKTGYRFWARLGPTGQTAWALPTPTPYPTPTPDPARLQLPQHVTPPLPGWTPPPIEEVPYQNAQERFEVLLNFLNDGSGVVTEALTSYLDWAAPYIDPTAPPNWVRVSDLDGDGEDEVLLSVFRVWGIGDGGPNTCGMSLCPARVFLLERQGALFVPFAVWRRTSGDSIYASNPELLLIEDLNLDGELEWILKTHSCGAHTCFNALQIGQWDGSAPHILGQMSQSYSEISIVDWDGDGLKDIVMHGGIVGSAGAGTQRQRTEVYAWRDGAYQQVAKIPDFEPANLYFLMLDANAALKAGDLDTALERAMAVAETYPSVRQDPWETSRIVSYALVEAMMVHALRGEVGSVEALLRDIERDYDRLENPYVEAAQRFWGVYQETRDPYLACQAVERSIREYRHQVEFLTWYGYAMEQLALRDVCPLD